MKSFIVTLYLLIIVLLYLYIYSKLLYGVKQKKICFYTVHENSNVENSW
jgi:hypothetical protein